MTSKKMDMIKRLVKSLDVKPSGGNIHVLGICEECHFPGIELNPFAPHAETCSKAVKV